MRRPTRCGGFTLLETLTALALIALLSASLYAGMRIGFHSRERAEKALAPARAATAALEFLRADVVSAAPPTGVLAGAFAGTDAKGERTGDDADTLAFFTAADDAAGRATAFRKIEYALVEEETGASLLVRRVTANLLAPRMPEPVEEVVCRNVLSFNVTYYDGVSWLDAWDSTARGNVLPFLVQATLRLRPASRAPEAESDAYALTRTFVLPCAAEPAE